ncbi:hypothetical protein GH733_011344 [Mirounga leonina]|nr:hypothetical protein GH733_011344 [Mirounga leonina]
MTQKSYKVPTSGPWAFSSRSYTSVPGTHISCSAFSQNLEQQNQIVETKWSLLQRQKTAQSNMDNMFKSYVNNFGQQLDTVAQEKLKLETELGNMQGLVKDFKNKNKQEIKERSKSMQRWEDKTVLVKMAVDEASMNKEELESHLEGLTDKSNSLRPLYEEENQELQSQTSDTSMVLFMDNSAPWTRWHHHQAQGPVQGDHQPQAGQC